MTQKMQRRFTLTLLVLLAALVVTGASVSAWAAPPKRPPKNQPCAAFEDNFDGNHVDSSRWVVANGQAPGRIFGAHIGYYQPERVSVGNGFLTIMLTQEGDIVDGVSGVISRGGLVYSKQKCGYGTYEWTMRMSSTSSNPSDPSGFPTSGSVSAGFIYVNNSETEIDFEFSGKDPEILWLVNWLNTNPRRDPTSQQETYTPVQDFDSTSGFHHYKFLWQPGSITFFLDGEPRAVHTTDVPSAPAYFMINHWGTNGPYWGGMATLDVPRYFYVNSVRYTPLP